MSILCPHSNLDELDQFTERHKEPKLMQEEINNLNRTTFIENKLSQYLIMFQEKNHQIQRFHWWILPIFVVEMIIF